MNEPPSTLSEATAPGAGPVIPGSEGAPTSVPSAASAALALAGADLEDFAVQVHHSQLRVITPTIRAHYPGLMEDHAVLPMVRSMFAILFGRECVQCADDASCRGM